MPLRFVMLIHKSMSPGAEQENAFNRRDKNYATLSLLLCGLMLVFRWCVWLPINAHGVRMQCVFGGRGFFGFQEASIVCYGLACSRPNSQTRIDQNRWRAFRQEIFPFSAFFSING